MKFTCKNERSHERHSNTYCHDNDVNKHLEGSLMSSKLMSTTTFMKLMSSTTFMIECPFNLESKSDSLHHFLGIFLLFLFLLLVILLRDLHHRLVISTPTSSRHLHSTIVSSFPLHHRLVVSTPPSSHHLHSSIVNLKSSILRPQRATPHLHWL